MVNVEDHAAHCRKAREIIIIIMRNTSTIMLLYFVGVVLTIIASAIR